jgi:carboxylesterase
VTRTFEVIVEHERIQPGCEPWHARGDGDRADTAVILTHGFTANPMGTRPLGERLHAAGFTVHVLRLPGHGTTVEDFAASRYPDWRAEVDRAVTDAREAGDRVVLVGHSMGGTLSLDVGSARPGDVAGVVAINAQILNPEQLMAKLAPLLQYVLPVVPRDLAGLPTNDIAKPDVSENAYPKVGAKAAQSLIRALPGIRARLLDLTQPLLVVSSPQDHTVPPKNSDAVVELVGSGDITRIVCERSYHVPQLDWDREQVEEGVLAFVEKIAADESAA